MKKLISMLLILSLGAISISAGELPANQTIIKIPQEASDGLYQAWRGKRKAAAANFARQEAIDKLFSVRRQKMTFKGCTKSERGEFECVYENKKLDLSLAMIVKSYRAGYRVASVSFSSEAI